RRSIIDGRLEEALQQLFRSLEIEHITETQWNERLDLLSDVCGKLRLNRARATIRLYRGQSRRAEELTPGFPTDLARAALERKDRLSAARHFERAGWFGHAAIEIESTGDDRAARVLWEHLLNSLP